MDKTRAALLAALALALVRQETSNTLTLVDDDGRVRVRIGKLDKKGGYGLDLFDAHGVRSITVGAPLVDDEVGIVLRDRTGASRLTIACATDFRGDQGKRPIITMSDENGATVLRLADGLGVPDSIRGLSILGGPPDKHGERVSAEIGIRTGKDSAVSVYDSERSLVFHAGDA